MCKSNSYSHRQVYFLDSYELCCYCLLLGFGQLSSFSSNIFIQFQNRKACHILWYHLIKANMSSYILLQTAAIFCSIEPLSKTGYWLCVCHGWFYLQGLTRCVKNASRVRITKLKILAHCGIRTRDLPFTKRARYHWATKTDVSWADKNSPGFTCAIFRNLPVARVRWSKIICRLFLSYDICIGLLFTN